ncbi:hypothetical protein X798_06075, partial [Onchocerca flexuosa]
MILGVNTNVCVCVDKLVEMYESLELLGSIIYVSQKMVKKESDKDYDAKKTAKILCKQF